MPGATEVGTASKIISGPCDVRFATTSVGHTEGDVTVTLTRTTVERTVNQFGTNPYDEIITGGQMTVTFTMKEETLANLFKTVPNSPYLGDEAVGSKASAAALALTIRSITDTTKYVKLFKAVRTGDIVWNTPANTSGNRTFAATFKALFDATKGTNGALGIANFTAS